MNNENRQAGTRQDNQWNKDQSSTGSRQSQNQNQNQDQDINSERQFDQGSQTSNRSNEQRSTPNKSQR